MNAALWDLTVPVDSSDSAQRGVAYAIELGRAGATVHFCSVVDVAGACLGEATGALTNPQPLVEAMNQDAQRNCDDAVAQALRGGVVADGTVVFGAIAPAIRQFSKDHTSDALVIGTHARTGLARAFVGSTAERLMQTSLVPVLVTHADDLIEDGPIAVAVDGARSANSALTVAIELARSQSRRLVIMNVGKETRESLLASESILRDAADIAREARVDFEIVALEGAVADQIIATATSRNSSMIVIGTSGRSDLARALVGSVAAAVVEHAHVPVAVVRES